MFNFSRGLYCILVGYSIFISMAAHSAVTLDRTRIIFPGTEKSINITISNDNPEEAYLAQSWIEDLQGNKLTKGAILATPPLQRIEPNSYSLVRLSTTPELHKLPQDRESLFYLNVLDIPAKPKVEENSENSEGNNNYLQLAVRSRIKFFFRPDNLNVTPDDAYQKVTWHQEGALRIKAINPTPYYITYNKISVGQDKQLTPVEQSGMIAPFSSKIFSLKEKPILTNKVTWVVVNDYGGYQQGESTLE
ncbi:fimbrial biogenesis chaperone [Proteus mirabilis]|uniref:fimbrial biogenesis chaperone n=4 Tax=Proteus mirabilis TaxID=584 RepID=UPI001073DB32|nr:molecular chaperone [Proteus mirabilis]TFT59813.1 molecular chaperone [Proteus mirabilis]